MKAIGKIIGTILWFGSGAVLFVFWFIAMTKWMGFVKNVRQCCS